MIGGAPLDGGGDDLTGPLVGLVLELALDLLELDGGVMLGFVFHLGHQLGLGLLDGQTGDLFQHFQLAGLEGGHLFPLLVQLLELLGELFFLGFDALILAVQGFFLLLDAAFLLLNFGAALLALALVFGAGAEDLLPRFHHRFTFFGLRGLDGVVDDPFCFILGTADFLFCNFFSIEITCENSSGGNDNQS